MPIEFNRPRMSRDQLPIAVIAAPKGFGKSSIAKEVMQSLSEYNSGLVAGLERVEMGDEIFKGTKNFAPRAAVTKDEMRKESSESIDTWLAFTLGLQAGKVSALGDKEALILVAQPVYEHNGKLVSGAHHYRSIRPALYINIWADPKHVQEWTRRDLTRKRPQQSRRRIAAHMRASMRVTAELARDTGAKLVTVRNRPGNLRQTADEVATVIKNFLVPPESTEPWYDPAVDSLDSRRREIFEFPESTEPWKRY